MQEKSSYCPKNSYIRVASACPEVGLSDVATNIKRIKDLYNQCTKDNVALVTFPEMSVTGYTLGDLVLQTNLLSQAKNGLAELADYTKDQKTAMVVGLPMQIDNSLYNCAAIVGEGLIYGIVPKSNLPNYNEFYEKRWYEAWDKPNTNINIAGVDIPFGTDLLFEIGGVKVGIEICEDLWVNQPPSGELAEQGAVIIANPSASPEQIGKSEYRKNLVALQSARLLAGYVYSGCDASESTAEVVMSGHQMIANNGHILAEKKPFANQKIIEADIDIDHINFDRRRLHIANKIGHLVINTSIARRQEDLRLNISKNPFLPSETDYLRGERFDTALNIQANGLAQRMKNTHQDRLVLGLSGGLDSTLALLVATKAAQILGKTPQAMIQTLTMPGPASSEQTQNNAQELAAKLGIDNQMIPINKLVKTELDALDHDGLTQDITYENVQARARTSLLFNWANKNKAIVLGTGDLSEIAMGWCTYNADQQSHYNVNASIPKTLVKHLVKYVADQPDFTDVKAILYDILNTPISPELTTNGNGQISQNTEDIIGPYELHDFFLYYLIRFGDSPSKIAYLAKKAYEEKYSSNEIEKWLQVFLTRFAQNQFKRENLPNGPKVGSVSLSPRGDWRMPPDIYNAGIWQ